jgi:SAM-dependent methyltransferase
MFIAGYRKKTALAVILSIALLSLAGPGSSPAIATMDSERVHMLDAPFVPTPIYAIMEMLHKAGVGKDDILYDLGSGDGRIVIEAARRTGCRAVGVELDTDLVEESRAGAVRAGVQDRVRFVVADIFRENISEATVVTLYMGGAVNVRLRPKLFRELKPGSRVTSYTFDMGEWKPDAVSTFGREDAYFWVIPANASGTWTWTEGKGRSQVRWELELKQVFQGITGQARLNGQPVAVKGAKLRGDEIRLTLEGGSAAGSPPIELAGRIRGDRIEGTARAADTQRAWKAGRTPGTMQRIDP